MGKELTGPFGAEINAKHAEWQQWKAKANELEIEIAKATADHNPDALAKLMAKRQALPLILKALEKEHAALLAQRAESFREQTRAREIVRAEAMDAKPRTEIITEGLGAGNRIVMTRAKF